MGVKFIDAIDENTLVQTFDGYHEVITGRPGYMCSENRDGSGADDLWYKFRLALILSCKRALMATDDE